MPIRLYWKSVVRVTEKFIRKYRHNSVVQATEKFFQNRRHVFIIFAGIYSLVLVATIWALFVPQTLTYSFGSIQNCRVSPRLFPSASTIHTGESFTLKRAPSVSIGSAAIYSHKLCASATSAPKAQTTYSQKERVFNWPILGHTLRVTTKRYPVLARALTDRKTLPPASTMRIALDQSDATFTYAVKTGDKIAPCTIKQTILACKLDELQLSYAQKYDLSIERQFNKKSVATLAIAPITTLTPVDITSTSIPVNSVAQHKPTELVIETNKKLTELGSVVLVAIKGDKTETIIPTTATLSGTAIKVTFGAELPRKTTFELRLASLLASDGSGLASKSFAVPFSTSGGPKVTNSNIGNHGASQTPSIAIDFDQTLLATQDPASLVSLLVQGQPQPATLRISGNRIFVNPVSPLPLCATFSIKINEKVQSQFGISGDSTWSINSRAICYTSFSIGTSVKGRAIMAYKFGSGANPIVYIGAMHGSEANSRAIMNEWFYELNANPQRLTSRSLVIISSVSPDGIAASSRLNANGVDLNRNFPAADWKSVVTSPDSPNPTPSGGPSPLSEPESQALAAYIQRTQPRLTMSFHSAAGVVEANEAGDSVSIATTYASKARYQAIPKSQSATVFKYDTTGAMEDWMRSSLGSPAIVVELYSRTSSEFSRNRDALWYTAGL